MFLLKVIFYVVICLLAPPNSMFFYTVYTLPCFKQLLLPATTWCYSCIVSQYIVLQFIACYHHRHCSHFSSFSLTYWHVDIVDPFSRLQCWHVDVLLLLTSDALTLFTCWRVDVVGMLTFDLWLVAMLILLTADWLTVDMLTAKTKVIRKIS